jgi:phosphatidylglycerophosphate synthase
MVSYVGRGENLVTIAFETVGENRVKVFSLDPVTRAHRLARKAGLDPDARPDEASPRVVADLGYAWDPAWLRHVAGRPGAVITLGGRPVLAHAQRADAPVIAAMRDGAGYDGPGVIRAEQGADLHDLALRKREIPFVLPLRADTARRVERAAYDGAYKGVTDILTLYLWRRPAFYLTRGAAAAGISPNLVTTLGAALCILAFFLFWHGAYWAGVAAGFTFMVLDTVDGKLARCTGTSSRWGHVFDHGVDLIHPPFWWVAWGVGLDDYGTPLSPHTLASVLTVILVGYIVQRAIEGIFMRRFGGIHIHVWRPIDSWFRLITARRNPNMVILVAALLLRRPDIGLIVVAAWTALSLVFHAVRLAQALIDAARGRPVVSWLA